MTRGRGQDEWVMPHYGSFSQQRLAGEGGIRKRVFKVG